MQPKGHVLCNIKNTSTKKDTYRDPPTLTQTHMLHDALLRAVPSSIPHRPRFYHSSPPLYLPCTASCRRLLLQYKKPLHTNQCYFSPPDTLHSMLLPAASSLQRATVFKARSSAPPMQRPSGPSLQTTTLTCQLHCTAAPSQMGPSLGC